jgi:acyl carrier protein
MNNIISTFTEVRSVTKRIINIVAENSGIDSAEITLRSSINFDLGVDGDDWDDILHDLIKKEKINFEGFEVQKYFNSEAEISNNGIYFLLFLPFIFITFIIDRAWRYTSFKEYFYKRFDADTKKQKLTIADIVVSKFAGQFMRRSDVRVEIIRNCA